MERPHHPLAHAPAEGMTGYPASTLVNSPSNREAELISEAPLNSA